MSLSSGNRSCILMASKVVPWKTKQHPESVLLTMIGTPISSHWQRKTVSHSMDIMSWLDSIRKSLRTWHMELQSLDSSRNWMASKKALKMVHPTLQPVGNVQSHNQCLNHPKLGHPVDISVWACRHVECLFSPSPPLLRSVELTYWLYHRTLWHLLLR